MPSREELESIVIKSSAPPVSVKNQISYDDMLHLADVFEGWAQDLRIEPQRCAELLGWASGMRRLAALVGPEWNPPEPAKLSLIGFLARKLKGT